jgi:predicted deacylase
MKISRISRAGSLVVAAGIAAGVFAAPACADTTANIDNFLTTLDGLGITDIAPGDAVELGQSLCPLLADRGQNTADIAAKVSDAIGRPLGPATMFTGMAISFLCPKAVGNITDTLTNGKPLLPLFG